MLSPRRSLSRRIGFGAIVISVLLFASCGDESSADAEPAAVDAGASDAAPVMMSKSLPNRKPAAAAAQPE